MKPTVYIETTIISYLTARPSTDIHILSNQFFVKLWWEKRRDDFDLCTSLYTHREAQRGDPDAAAARLTVLADVPLIEVGPDVERLADALLAATALPVKARIDAYHLAAATCGGIEFLLTWNCRHLANAQLWAKIEEVCADAGFKPPVICTPYMLIGDAYDPGPDR